MSDGLQYERYVWFHGQIKAGKHPNSRHLAEEFEISGRTAQRTIEFMRDRFAAPLAFNRGRNGYFYTDDAYELPGHWISETNVLSLALAVRLASTIPDPALKDDLCRLIERVTGTQGRRGKSCLQHLPEKISVKNIEYAEVDIAIFRQIVEALFGDRTISVTYHSPHSKTLSTRTIRPLHLMHYMGSWYLLAWCSTRQAMRDFALARIRSIAAVKEAISLPSGLPSVKDYTRRHFGIMQGAETIPVTLRFSAKIAPLIREQIWHPEQKIDRTGDGGLMLSFPAAGFHELVRIVLGHGAEVQVVEPEELRVLIQQEIERMTKIYLPL